MDALEDGVVDGNAIGGLLIEVFGTEMTTAVGTCARCGTPPARWPSWRCTGRGWARSSGAVRVTTC